MRTEPAPGRTVSRLRSIAMLTLEYRSAARRPRAPLGTAALVLAAAILDACAQTPSRKEREVVPVTSSIPPPAAPAPAPAPEQPARRGNPPFYDVMGQRYHVLSSGEGYHERGVASWYGREFHGRSTASGEPYD